MEKLKTIIRNNQMCTSPEFYSGRGAKMCDLNGQILEGIYKGIKKEFGANAAKNFVGMVKDIKVLSATTFLEELYILYSNNWKYTKKENHAPCVSVPKDKNGEYDLAAGMFGMMEAMMSSGRDDTQMIKNGFLMNHGVKPKERVYSADGYEVMYYFD
jgi:hypothetical protein